jgi:hypothetical protein
VAGRRATYLYLSLERTVNAQTPRGGLILEIGDRKVYVE